MSVRVISALNPEEMQALQRQGASEVLVLKFGADWCGPCQRLKPLVACWLAVQGAHIRFVEIDVDESLDLYLALKRKRMVSALPTMLAYDGSLERPLWYVPDDSVIGADVVAVSAFLARCTAKAGALALAGALAKAGALALAEVESAPYTYYT